MGSEMCIRDRDKIEAANLMQKAMSILKNHRMEESVFIDIENDPNETGLVGSPFSLITTDEGDLDSKLTTLDPNFSAVMVELMYQLGLKDGDTIAVLMTGSMPGANIAVLTACRALGVIPIQSPALALLSGVLILLILPGLTWNLSSLKMI